MSMKVLWHSVAPWAPTGYGQQTSLFAPRIRDLGHDVALSCYYGLQGSTMEWQGIRCLPSYSAAYGVDTLVPHAVEHFGGGDSGASLNDMASRGLVITLGDVWTLDVPLIDMLSVASWVPVDHLEVPDIVKRWFQFSGAIPVAMSKFGMSALEAAGGLNALYVPHGVDTHIFKPGDQAEAREATGVPLDAFIVGIVANNIGRDGNRKAFAEQITAFAQLHERHPDAFLMLHTDIDAPGGMNLRRFLERTLPADAFAFTDQYAYRRGITKDVIAQIFRSMDVLTNCSYGEGFGVPIIEAQACGRPVIVTDATAMPELVGAGWTVEYERMWHDSQGGWAAVPRIGAIADAYELAYDKATDQLLREEAWAFAQSYDADRVTDEYWRPALARLEAAMKNRAAHTAAAPRGARRAERVVAADGYVWLERENSDDWVATSDHEPYLWRIFEENLPEGGVLLDVGAHVGRWAIRMSGRAGLVIAVEANPTTVVTLRRHLAMNDIDNVEVVQLAAWDEPAMVTVADPNQRTDGGGTRTLMGADAEGVVVPAERLDESEVVDYLDVVGRLDLVKVDVEGADIHVLRGLAGILAVYQPTLLIECHDIYGYYERADLEATLDELGYTYEVAAQQASNWQPGIGIIDEVRIGDYLLARPKEGTAP